MKLRTLKSEEYPRHTGEMQDIISKPPSWLLQWGISLFFVVLLSIVWLAEYIRYPDVIKTELKIISVNTSLFAEMAVPQSAYSKIKKGQEVLIKLKSYPFEQYGIIRGVVRSINSSPSENGTFTASVEINKKGLSSFNPVSKIRKGLEADAEIITENISLWKRLTQSLFKTKKFTG